MTGGMTGVSRAHMGESVLRYIPYNPPYDAVEGPRGSVSQILPRLQTGIRSGEVPRLERSRATDQSAWTSMVATATLVKGREGLLPRGP